MWNGPGLENEQYQRQINALYNLLAGVFGPDKLVLKAGKLESLRLMRSDKIEERVLGLQRLVYEDPTISDIPNAKQIPDILEELEDEIADVIARRTVEEKIERKIAERMQQRQEDYVKELKFQVLKETSGPENPQTQKKLQELERLEKISLSASARDKLRPRDMSEVLGQERAIQAMMAKLVTPFPQHVILYGPPGVGKTTVARLALEVAKKLKHTPFLPEAKFVEVDGTTLRWDPREITNPLLGSVHDPIYQGARRDLAEGGVPEPKLGLVTEAHGGVLFIDEIGEMDSMLQNKLLKVLEDKRVYFDSAYYDGDEQNTPKYIQKLFNEGAPADFILIAATTKEPDEISPAIRSRCSEVYFEPLTPDIIREIVVKAAERLEVEIDQDVPELISEYTIEGRKATSLLADAYGAVLYRRRDTPEERLKIAAQDVLSIIQTSRLSPHVQIKASSGLECGRIYGLGVSGFLGSVLEIEAISFPAREAGKGTLRFNETAGSMTKDSVFNALSVVRKLTGIDPSGYDIHINVVGGGRIDGPSAGMAIALVIISCLTGQPLRQDVAVTGEISIQGKIKPVGGIYEKIFGAKQAGFKIVLIPGENEKDVPSSLKGIKVMPLNTLEEAADVICGPIARKGEADGRYPGAHTPAESRC
ncbi:MAG: Lon family ATP-dependent protease [Bacillota bacterium]